MAETTTTICRTCLQQITEDVPYHFLNNENDLMLQSKLLDFLPELDLNITQNPITCSQCTRTINEIHHFKQLCLQTENLLKKQELPFNDALHIFKKEQLDETIKEEFVEDPIKNESFSLQTVEDQCVQINTHIPVCIEEFTTTKASYYCYNCNYCTDKKNNLIKHVLIHRNEISVVKTYKQEVQSNTCNYVDNQKELVKNYKCCTCNYETQSKTVMVIHNRTHTRDKPFSCNTCDYRSENRSRLKIHSRIHTGEKPFCCNVCDYQTAQKVNLKMHLRIHTGEKPFCCNICDYRSAQASHLKTHLLRHTGEKRFCCNMCDYRTALAHHLRTHLLRHTGEKPFCCNICNYRTNVISHLKRHSRKHTGEKPFSCNICNYQTAHKECLRKHLYIHT